MKVCQLLEDEWENQKVTLDILDKKQKSASAHFIIALHRFCDMDASIAKDWGGLKTLSNARSEQLSRSTLAADMTRLGIVSLNVKWNRMIAAKKQYEDMLHLQHKKKVLETDEFTNRESTLDHLSKIQKARSFEVWSYIRLLLNKYNIGWKSATYALIWFSVCREFDLLTSWASPQNLPSNLPDLNDQEKAKHKTKFDRMIIAKKAFEDAGGKYEHK